MRNNAYSREVAADSPQLYWPLHDPTGQATDLGASGRHGTVNGTLTRQQPGPVLTQSQLAAEGQRRLPSAFGFPGATGNYIARAEAMQYANMTIEAWVWIDPAGPNTNQNIAATEDFGAAKGYRLGLTKSSATAAIPLVGFHTGALQFFGSVALPVGRWFHYVGTVDGSNARIFVDGASRESRAQGSLSASTVNLKVGQYANSAAEPFQGRLAHFAIYSSALSADRIRAHYLVGRRAAKRQSPLTRGSVGMDRPVLAR